jgi:hypothetical protein
MNKSEAINLLNNEGWTKEDAKRALLEVDFSKDLDELRVLQQINDPKSENYAIVKQTSSVQSVPCWQNLPSN